MSYWIGYISDLLVGDPLWMPHPIRYIGKWIRYLESKLLDEGDSPGKQKFRGVVLVLLTVGAVAGFYTALLWGAFQIHPAAGFVIQAFVFFQMMATRCLGDEGMKLYHALGPDQEELADGLENTAPSLESARRQLSMLVSRDTGQLSREDIVKAGVETVSENLADGIVAPLFFTAIGGVPLGMAYKAINTLDSMVGYKNSRYLSFGWASAKLDDLATWIPARLSGGLVILVSLLTGKPWKRAARIMIRDRRNHESPNSPYPEAAVAGALGIQLGGRAAYFGVAYDKKTMGDALERPGRNHLKKAVRLVYGASMAAFLIWQALLWLVRYV